MIGKNKKTEILEAALDVVTYLQSHPDARDTLRGVAEWWVHCSEDVAEEALTLLLRRGLVERKGSHFGAVGRPPPTR